jgi:sugar phosphate isomerase/epimerase
MKPNYSLPTLAALLASLPLLAAPIPNEQKINGFALSGQAENLSRTTAFAAIEKAADAGSKTIEFTPSQFVTDDTTSDKWNHIANDQIIARVKDKLARHGIRPVSYGPVEIPNNEAAARQIFEFAKKLDLYAITTESVDSLDLIESLAKEYDIFVAIAHQPKRLTAQGASGRQVEDTSYKLWHPEYLRDLVAKRDRHIGVCADLGHWQSSGFKAIDCVKLFEGRLITVRAKERAALGPGQADIPLGTGITDMPAILTELKRQKFEGPLTPGLPDDGTDPLPKLKQAVDFIRNWKPSD